MKKIIMLSLSILLIYGCSPNNDSNNDPNNDPSGVPPAPTNLTGQVINPAQINLSWTNNSNNHTEFKIERKSGAGSFEVIANEYYSNSTTYSDNNYGYGLSQNTTYIYRICYLNGDLSSQYSNELTITTSIFPIITTITPNLITPNTANSGGIITNAGGISINVRGVVWSKYPNPTIGNSKTIDGMGEGTFTSSLTELGENITYYIRAYYTSSFSTIYGNEVTFTTLNYQTQNITICNQVWMQKNLNTSHYRNGDVIPQVTDQAQWEALTSGAWCYYNNDPSTGAVYGKLYNWYAVTDPRGLAPTGYHVPSYTEYLNFSSLDCNGFNTDITFGGKLKEVGTTHWISPNTGATNETGFTGLPGGQRNNALAPFSGFEKLGTKGCFWLSTGGPGSSYTISAFFLYNDSQSAAGVLMQNASKNNGYSVRCIKD